MKNWDPFFGEHFFYTNGWRLTTDLVACLQALEDAPTWAKVIQVDVHRGFEPWMYVCPMMQL